MRTAHNEKCMKYKKQIEELKLDLMELQEEKDKMISLTREEKSFIFTGLEMYWKQELNRDNQKASKAEQIDKVRAKIANTMKGKK